MATLKQIEASRRNGAKSRGPVTQDGKARVSQNGVTHGIYAQTVVLENEDEDLYSAWRDNHLAEWAPATDTELNLVIDIVDARWRLRRLSVLETKALDFEVGRMQPEVDEAFDKIDEGTRTVLALNSLITLNRSWEVIQTSIRSQHRIIDRATAQLLRLGKVRRQPLDDDGPNTAAADSTEPPRPESAFRENLISAAEDGNIEKQTREMAQLLRGTQQNSESKPGRTPVGTLPRPRTVFAPTLDTRLRAA